MDALNSGADHLFSLPVALIFQNESSGEKQDGFVYNTSAAAAINESQSSHNWKKDDVVLSGLQKLEKVGVTIRKELKWAFILHAYGFGCLFFILAFYTFFSILNIRSFISSRPFMTTINGFLCLLGTSRGAFLFIDPYSLKESMPKLLGQVLWDLGFPSIISAFCLVQLAFFQFTQLRIGPEGLRKKSCLSLIVTAQFLLTIGMDLVAGFHESLMVVVKQIFQYVFLIWGIFLYSNFLYTGYKVMSMIRKIPGGLPNSGYKGIMQLAILAPQSNLADSMAAVLLPTLCAPKIHQQDNNNLSVVGFRSDGSSRILESESIPKLEEMTGSSGDEISSKSVARRSSFRSQVRNHSQKFNLRPKLSFASALNHSKDEEDAQVRRACSGMKSSKSASPKNQSPTTLLFKTNEYDFNYKSDSGIPKLGKHRESFIRMKSVHEFKTKTQHATCIENENFHVANENKIKSNFHSSLGLETSDLDNVTPIILVTNSDNSVNDEVVKAMKREDSNFLGSEKNKKTLGKLMREISKDLNEMQILREEKTCKAEEIVEVHAPKINKFETERDNGLKNKMEVGKYADCKKEPMTNRKESLFRKKEYRNSTCGKQCGSSKFETCKDAQEVVNICPSLTEIGQFEETKTDQKKFKVKSKSLAWKIKTENERQEEEEEEEDDDDEEEKAAQECLLLQKNSEDVTLKSALSQVPYINRETSGKADNYDELEKVRKSKVEWVLNITYITAMWGLMLCLSNMGKIYSPFGIPESPKEIFYLNSTYIQSKTSTEENENGILFSSWPWLWFQTFCRALELAMGCAMANITRQPTANHRYSRTLSFRHRDIFYNI